MKKKFISLVVFLFSIFFIGNIEVFAANNPYPISAHDIPSDTYIIGTHAFDENRTYLSTQDIMWAARTIDAESIDDMIIYYKDMNGVWIDGLTGENITVPSTFRLEAVNSEKVQMALINNVSEKVEQDNGMGTAYQSIYEENYNVAGFSIEKEKGQNKYLIYFDAYNFKDGEYNFNLQCHKYEVENDEFIPSPFNIGTTPQTINISGGTFTVSVDITSTDFDYVSCAMELEKDDEVLETGFSIWLEEPTPTLIASALGIGYNEPDVGAGSGVIYSDDMNTFYLINNEYLTKDLEFAFLSRYIEEGDYKLEVNVTKDGKIVNIDAPESTIIGEGLDPVFGYSNTILELKFEEQINVGEYEFEITLKNADDEKIVTEYVYLLVSDETKMEISNEIFEEPATYYSLDELTFKRGEKRTFNMDIFTENIPEGTYAIKSNLEYLDMVVPANFELKHNQNIKIIKSGDLEYFDFSFEIPKNTKVGENVVPLGVGKYFVELTLHELVEDEFGSIIVNKQAIAKTSFTFTIESDVVYGDINLDGKIDIGDSVMVLRYANDLDVLTSEQLSRADVSGDGFINTVDALLIQGYEAGYYPNTLPNKQIENYVLYGDTLNAGDLFKDESAQAYSVIEQYLNGNTNILTEQALKNADVNGDGVVNHVDKVLIYGYINDLVQFSLPSFVPITDYILYGDVTNNGIVDTEDVVVIRAYNSGTQTLSPQGIKNADVNNDGVINETDYELIQHGIADNVFVGDMPLFNPIVNN